MTHKIDILDWEFGDRVPLWSCQVSVTFNPGVTALVGCNGSGKTTMLKHLNRHLRDLGENVTYYDAHKAGDKLVDDTVRFNSTDQSSLFKKMTSLSTLMSSSEGEKISFAFGEFMTKLGEIVRGLSDGDSAWLLVDSLDSGLSLDRIDQIIDVFNLCVLPDVAKMHAELYVIIAVNDYAFTRDVDCVSMSDLSHVSFKSYEDYVDFIRETSDERFEAYKSSSGDRKKRRL